MHLTNYFSTALIYERERWCNVYAIVSVVSSVLSFIHAP